MWLLPLTVPVPSRQRDGGSEASHTLFPGGIVRSQASQPDGDRGRGGKTNRGSLDWEEAGAPQHPPQGHEAGIYPREARRRTDGRTDLLKEAPTHRLMQLHGEYYSAVKNMKIQ